MRSVLSLLALVFLFSCKSQKKPVAISYLNKDAVFNKDSVRAFLERVSTAQTDSGKAVFLKGVDFLKNSKNGSAAVEAFVQSLTIYPTATAYYELGNAYLQTKNWQTALRSFEMAEAMNYTPIGSTLFGQASCYAEMDSTERAFDYLTYAVQNGFVDRTKFLSNPHFASYKSDGTLLTTYNQAMSGNGDPDEILWQGYTQDFKSASFPYRVDSGSLRKMGDLAVISYDYEKYVPEMRDNKFSRDVGSEYFYVAKVMQTELCSVVLYGCHSYEYGGAPSYYILASFNNKGKLIDKMVVGGAKTFDDNYKEFTAQSATRFQIQEYKNTYEKSTDENGYEDNRVTARSLIGTQQFSITSEGKFVTAQQG